MSTITENKPKKYARSVKCPECEINFDRNIEPFQEHGGRWYHQACFEIRFAEIQTRNNLIDYICYLHKIKAPTGYMFKQIKEFEENNNFKPSGIQMTLQYYHEIKDNPVIQGTGIGIVEYFYDEARSYFTNLGGIAEHNKNIKVNKTEEVIYVQPPKNRERKLIDLEGLF